MHAIEKQREKTFIEKGLSKDIVKSRDFYDFMNSNTWDSLSKILDSDRVNTEYNRVAGSGLPPAKIEQAMSDISIKRTAFRSKVCKAHLIWPFCNGKQQRLRKKILLHEDRDYKEKRRGL